MGEGAARELNGFTLVELLIVIGVMGILTGLGLSGAQGVRQWMGKVQSEALFMELEAACGLYRLEAGSWPTGSGSGEVALNGADGRWRKDLSPFMENQNPEAVLEDGFGNRNLFMIMDTDGDHWIEENDFEALGISERPTKIWKRVGVYSLDSDGKLAAKSW